jgi:hypothetical protein
MVANLDWTEMDPDSADKEGLFNDGLLGIDAGMTAALTITWATGTTQVTPSASQWKRCYEVRINPNGGTPPTSSETLAINVTNIAQKPFIVTNNTLGSVQISSGGFIVSPGEKKMFYYNGTSVIQVSGARDNLLKSAVRVAHGSNVTISTALNVGDSLSGVTLALQDRVLLYGQTDPKENGIYFVSGSPGRTDDADETGEILPGTQVYIRAGTNAGKLFFCTNSTTPTIGTDNITWDDVGSGLTGSYLKLDGSTTMTGALKAAAGSLGSPSITFGADTDTGFDNALGANIGRAQGGGAEAFRWGSSPGLGYGATPDSTYSLPFLLSGSGSALALATSNMSVGPAYFYRNSGGTQIAAVGEGSTNGTGFTAFRAVTSASGPNNILLKSRGTPDSPSNVSQNDQIGAIFFGFYSSDIPGFRLGASLVHHAIAATPDNTHIDSQFRWNIGSGTGTVEFMRGDHTSGLQMIGANTVIDVNRILRTRSYTKATLPTVTTTGIIYCSDEDGGGCQLFSDGTNWRRVWDRKISGTTNKKKQTIWVPAGAITPRTTSGCAALASNETATNKVNYNHLDFDASAIEYAQFAVRMPKSWDESTVTYMVAWCHPATTTNFGVVWGLQGLALSDAEALETAFGTAVTVTDTGGSTATRYATAESSAVTIGSSPAAEDLVYFQIYRDATNGSDTLAVDAQLLGVSIFYNTDDDTDV